MAAMAYNNAFGPKATSWNMAFPEGNLTAAEILAYLPHWLKSMDVILRLVGHGGRAITMAAMINKYRELSQDMLPNSVTVMMHYAMRQIGFNKWTTGLRHEFQYDRTYDEDDLYVGNFRAPRITHPKSASYRMKATTAEMARNAQAKSVPFTELAHHVKQHPSGDDALDLTRCIQYALNHPDEEWLFPDQFQALVAHLGGPIPATHSHLDRQVFARYDKFPTRNPANPPWVQHNSNKPPPKSSKAPRKKKAPRKPDPNKAPRLKALKAMAAKASPKTDKLGSDGFDSGHNDGGQRRSRRRVKRAPVYVDKDDDATDLEPFDTAVRKKHPLSRMPSTVEDDEDDESEFEAKDESDSDDEIKHSLDEVLADMDFTTPFAPHSWGAASNEMHDNMHQSAVNMHQPALNLHQPALNLHQPAVNLHQSAVHMHQSAPNMPQPFEEEESSASIQARFDLVLANARPAHPTFANPTPEMWPSAREFAVRDATFLQPPLPSPDRAVVDDYTVLFWAQPGCRTIDEMYTSALSFYRFNGAARTTAPYRELYRLTLPEPWDTEDWAENVRWAKEQHRLYGSTTWIECQEHLDQITAFRLQHMWSSEEAILMRI